MREAGASTARSPAGPCSSLWCWLYLQRRVHSLFILICSLQQMQTSLGSRTQRPGQMVPSSGDLSSLTKPPLCFWARGEQPGGLQTSRHAATLGWEPDEHQSQQQLLGSHFAYYSKRFINGCFGSGVSRQEWTEPRASWELSSCGCTMCGPGWGWRGPWEPSAGSFSPGCCRRDKHPPALALHRGPAPPVLTPQDTERRQGGAVGVEKGCLLLSITPALSLCCH